MNKKLLWLSSIILLFSSQIFSANKEEVRKKHLVPSPKSNTPPEYLSYADVLKKSKLPKLIVRKLQPLPTSQLLNQTPPTSPINYTSSVDSNVSEDNSSTTKHDLVSFSAKDLPSMRRSESTPEPLPSVLFISDNKKDTVEVNPDFFKTLLEKQNLLERRNSYKPSDLETKNKEYQERLAAVTAKIKKKYSILLELFEPKKVLNARNETRKSQEPTEEEKKEITELANIKKSKEDLQQRQKLFAALPLAIIQKITGSKETPIISTIKTWTQDMSSKPTIENENDAVIVYNKLIKNILSSKTLALDLPGRPHNTKDNENYLSEIKKYYDLLAYAHETTKQTHDRLIEELGKEKNTAQKDELTIQKNILISKRQKIKNKMREIEKEQNYSSSENWTEWTRSIGSSLKLW